MNKFRDGEDVEVREYHGAYVRGWHKAKIISVDKYGYGYAQVQFPDGSRGVFSAEHIREIEAAEEYPGLAEPDDDTSEPMG